MEQRIERVREIFPQMSNREIQREIEHYGNVELAIMAITNR